ncbi:MAG: 3-oxoacyl-ACP reductase FabG [Deltaproteobacteria bacterium]|nr:3-oxoacyl-ACP reductase FabG [Deltaproteobacteria bacterium]
MGLLNNRTAVVTGAGRGIGRAIAETFVREGAKVVINDIDSDPAEEAKAACEKIAGEGCAITSIGSVADSAYTDSLMKAAADTFGKLDILVNNAGITRDKMIHNMSDEMWNFVIDINLKGTFNCIRSASPYLRGASKQEIESGGLKYHRKIINFFSTAALRGNPGQANYTAAKMGNVGLTRTIAQEWGRFGINVNAVAPGFTDTRLTKAKESTDGTVGIPAAQREAILKMIPFGRAGVPQDIANVVLFFASPLSDYVTGQAINVSGGLQIP